MNNYEYLNDASFLYDFDRLRVKEQYVKITALHFIKETELESLEGKITGGSLNVAGNSPVRRTGSLSLIADERTSHPTDLNSVIALNKKVKIEVGFLNDTKYYLNHEILWFPLGIYVITDASTSHGIDGTSVSINFVDKMCLLNGDVSGKLPAAIDLKNVEYIDKDGQIATYEATMFQMIMELVNHFGGEQLGKIIISDLPATAPMIVSWANEDENVYFYPIDGEKKHWKTVKYPSTEDDPTGLPEGTLGPYTFGELVGYQYTSYTYPAKELEAQPGDSICSVLDNIIKVLGNNYEYFYDVYGNFIFQEIKNYLNTTQATIDLKKIENSDYLLDRSQTKSIYSFEDNQLISSINNAPQYSLIKNDYIVWGERKIGDGEPLPLRYHLAIGQRPKTGNIYRVLLGKDNAIEGCPIRLETDAERLALVDPLYDYYYHVVETDKIWQWVRKMNSEGQYIEGSEWKIAEQVSFNTIVTNDYRTELYLQGLSVAPIGGSDGTLNKDYYIELQGNWDEMFELVTDSSGRAQFTDQWKQSALDNPYSLTYFLDIIDSGAKISELSIENIGRRTEVENASTSGCNCIFASAETPFFYFIDKDDKESEKYVRDILGCSYIYINDDSAEVPLYSDTDFIQDGKQVAAFDEVRNLLYQYTSYNESINFSGIPIYYLEPNTRITVRDVDSDVYGDYIINSITLPFDVNEEMSITATRALQKI